MSCHSVFTGVFMQIPLYFRGRRDYVDIATMTEACLNALGISMTDQRLSNYSFKISERIENNIIISETKIQNSCCEFDFNFNGSVKKYYALQEDTKILDIRENFDYSN